MNSGGAEVVKINGSTSEAMLTSAFPGAESPLPKRMTTIGNEPEPTTQTTPGEEEYPTDVKYMTNRLELGCHNVYSKLKAAEPSLGATDPNSDELKEFVHSNPTTTNDGAKFSEDEASCFELRVEVKGIDYLGREIVQSSCFGNE